MFLLAYQCEHKKNSVLAFGMIIYGKTKRLMKGRPGPGPGPMQGLEPENSFATGAIVNH